MSLAMKADWCRVVKPWACLAFFFTKYNITPTCVTYALVAQIPKRLHEFKEFSKNTGHLENEITSQLLKFTLTK